MASSLMMNNFLRIHCHLLLLKGAAVVMFMSKIWRQLIHNPDVVDPAKSQWCEIPNTNSNTISLCVQHNVFNKCKKMQGLFEFL